MKGFIATIVLAGTLLTVPVRVKADAMVLPNNDAIHRLDQSNFRGANYGRGTFMLVIGWMVASLFW